MPTQIHALRQIASWDVSLAAAAVVDRTGVVDTFGVINQPFPLASVTKLITSYATLIAVEEGTIDLNDPAGPEGSTVRHLISHASGLGFEGTERTVAPGTRRIYSNAGMELLADAVAKNAGMTFSDFVHAGIYTPLGMTKAHFGNRAAESAVASVAEIAKFMSELFAPTLINESTLQQAITVSYPGLAGIVPGFGRFEHCDWGLGFEIRANKSPHWTATRNSAQTYGHFGRSGTFLWMDPVAGYGLVALSDRPFGDWAKTAWPRLGDEVLAELTR